jgi:hypothetical protein
MNHFILLLLGLQFLSSPTSLSEIEPSEAPSEVAPTVLRTSTEEVGGFYQEAQLVAPHQLQVTSSEFLHVAVIVQILVGKDFKLGFKENADRMFSSLLRHDRN